MCAGESFGAGFGDLAFEAFADEATNDEICDAGVIFSEQDLAYGCIPLIVLVRGFPGRKWILDLVWN